MSSLVSTLVVMGTWVAAAALGIYISRTLRGVREYGGKLALILVTVAFGVSPFLYQICRDHSPLDAIHWGIDLAGGTNLVYQVEPPKSDEGQAQSLTPEIMSRLIGAVQKRVNPVGTKEVVVRQVGRDRIEIIIPGANEEAVQEIKDQITRLGSLEFSILANDRDHKALINRARETNAKRATVGNLVGVWREIAPEIDEKTKEEHPNTSFDHDREIAVRQAKGRPEGYKEVLVLEEPNPDIRITGKLLKGSRPTMDEKGRPAVGFNFGQHGGYLFQQLTSHNLPRKDDSMRRLAILLDNRVVSAPVIRSTIGSDGIIEGNFDEREVQNLVNVLNAGALPVELRKEPISEFTISPLLGHDVQSKGMRALWVSTLAVVVFMAGYYLLAGLVADFAMLLNLLFIVSMMVIIDAAFTLPGLAGLVLSAGMAVDANVLIYERIREETQRGASLRMAIHDGFDRALTAIVDSNLTTLMTAVILYMIGSEQVKGFAVSLFIGLVMNLFTAVYVSRVILEVLERSKTITRLKMNSLIGMTNIDFVGKQTIAIAASLVLIVIGLGAVAIRGADNLDIDFTGGTMVTMQFTSPQKTDDVRQRLETELGSNITLEELSSPTLGAPGTMYRLRTTDQDEQRVEQKVTTIFGTELARVELTVGPIKTIPGEKAKAIPDKKDADKKDASPEDSYAGGHEVELAFSRESRREGITAELTRELQGLKSEKGEPKYVDAETLFTVSGTSGPGLKAKATQVKLYDKMLLRATPAVDGQDLQNALKHIQAAMGSQPRFEETTSFESSVAQEAINLAVLAIIASLVAIIIYVWFRFERVVFGLAAVVALIHDVLVSLGCVALGAYLAKTPLGWPLMLTDFKINMPMIAAFLTIVGYSLNDTIVIFDRLREIRGKNPKVTKDMINLTVNQCLSRTLLTAFTVFVSVVLLYVLGGESIHGFAFCMVIGSIAGTYSTVYIASPLVLWFMERAALMSTTTHGRRPAAA